MTEPLDLLAIGPHPDDVELFCGGTVAMATGRGQRAGILDLTRGELASRGTVAQRADEAANAAEILRVNVRENLGLPDGSIASDEEAIGQLISVIRRLRPAVVLAPWHRARHPDHEAASHLVRRAVFLARLVHAYPERGAPHTVSRTLMYPMRIEPPPSFLVDISTVSSIKRAAILAHASQVQPDPDAVPTLVGSSGAVAAIEARDAYRGAQIGVPRAEAFVMDGAVPIDDPVAHFADRPEPHFCPEPR